MIEEIKKIKLEGLYEEKVEHDKIVQKVGQINSEIMRLEWEQERGLTVTGKFSFLEKWVTRRRDYKQFKEQSKRLSEVPKQIEELKHELDIVTNGEEYMVYETSDQIEKRIKSVKNAETIYEMGFTPESAIKLLESRGIKPVLSEEDKGIYSHPRDYSSKSSLIGVHKTRYMPMDNVIKTSRDAGVRLSDTIKLNGTEYTYSYRYERDTIHMAMNDEVSSHIMGSWKDCKYAILIPFADIPNEKIARAEPMDTFTRGSLDLPETAWILCPEEDVEKLRALNPKVHVLGYEGERALGYPQPFLTQLGYRAENVGMWNWEDEESAREFRTLMKEEKIETGPHTYTCFYEDECMLTKINKVIALSKLLRDNNLITKPEDIENIVGQLKEHNSSFDDILKELVDDSDKQDIDEQSIVGNHRQVDIFLKRMKENGFNISPAYQNVLQGLCKVTLGNCNKSNVDMIFDIPEETSEEEKTAMEELKGALASDEWLPIKREAFGKFFTTVMTDTILHSRERQIQQDETAR